MAYIKGNFKKYIYKSDSLYVVGLFKVTETSDEFIEYKNQIVTFTGYFSELNENDTYLFHGKFVEHNRYGNQFLVDSYEILLPDDKEKIASFLTSDLFPKIGEKKALNIVNALGEDCLNMILNDKYCLKKVKGLKDAEIDMISNNLSKYRYSYDIIVYLTKMGFNPKDALLIYNTYKEDTNNVINDNPYRIIDDINEISFKNVDRLRSNFKIDEYDLNRLDAAIKYVMEEVNFSFGSTYLSLNEIIMYTKKALFLSNESSIYNALENLVIDGDVIRDGEKYFINKMYEAEHKISDFLYQLTRLSLIYNVTSDSITKLEGYFGIKYNLEQKKAIKLAMKNNISVITGGPGTGKTTIIKAICKLYQDMNKYTPNELISNLTLLAPTGRAAKRMSEQTELPAYTIHRFLKWQKESNTFIINESNKSSTNFIIIDEASMLDTYLFYNLILGIKPGTKLVLIGDSNQLPSVGPGQILKDIIDSDIIPYINLKHLYRQEETSPINLLAHSINLNEECFDLFNLTDDMIFVPATSVDLKEKLKDYILKYKDYALNEMQVMAPIYKGICGIDELNSYIQDLINKKNILKNDVTINNVSFRENDKVLQLTNMPDLNIYNGDIGKIVKINKSPKEMLIDFDNNPCMITANNYNNLKLGYAISIHKSQGSEFDVVILPVLNNYGNMLYKKLIYTAITRAKKKLILIGEKEAFLKAINNNREQIRNTNLKEILISSIK